MTWFCGRLENVLQREVTIELTGLNYTVYNGQVGNILPFERNTVNYFSYDREEWHRFTCREFDQEARTFRLRQIFTRDTVWIAYTIPYPLTRLERLLTEVEGHPAVRLDTLGRSVEGRPLHLVTVAEPGLPVDSRPVVWLAARQHAFESGGSWALEGLLRFLASPDPEASRLRRRLTFRLCPLLNPDGVAHGHTRFNARGVDLNRHWHPRDPLSRDRELAPEIVLFKQALGKWRQDHRLDLFINLHNNDMVWNEDGDYIRFAPLEREDQARRLEKILRRGAGVHRAVLPLREPGGDRAGGVGGVRPLEPADGDEDRLPGGAGALDRPGHFPGDRAGAGPGGGKTAGGVRNRPGSAPRPVFSVGTTGFEPAPTGRPDNPPMAGHPLPPAPPSPFSIAPQANWP